MTLEGVVILNPSTITLSRRGVVILMSNAKDLVLLRVHFARSLRTSSVKDLCRTQSKAKLHDR